MLNFKQLALRRGTKLLFSDMNVTIHSGHKVGITGANGAGKSSLFALLRQQISADQGDFSLPAHLEVAHVAQETPALSIRALDYVLDGDPEYRQLEQKISHAGPGAEGEELAEYYVRFEQIGGYTAPSRASRLLDGLGFSPEQIVLPVSSFSGGWRMRLNLAQALMCRSDLLLLDEPTNHLDLDAVIWLQDWLVRYPGTLLLISHDRDFLDCITDHILHIEQEKVFLYTGNYSDFERMRAEKLSQQQSAFEKQQREIAHIQQFVDRFKAKATKARQAQSRIKSLERMELIAKAHVDSPFDFSFREPSKLPNPLLILEEANVGYGEKRIVKQVSLTVRPGDRIGLLGPNGAGKSTLIKVLAQTLLPMSGQLKTAQDLKIGYFAQHQLEQLTLSETPLWHFRQIDPLATEKELRLFLGGFDFRGDKVLETIQPFSGGEKARLVLALLVYQNPNLLLLDEPTNHLDLEMRHALSVALQDYQGAMVVVSHDRHLLRTVTDQFWMVSGGEFEPFEGDLDDYSRKLSDQKKMMELERTAENNTLSRKDQRKLEADRRLKLKPYLDAIRKAETQLNQYHEKQQALEAMLADGDLYAEENKVKLKTLLTQKAEVDAGLEQAEIEWMSAEEALQQQESL